MDFSKYHLDAKTEGYFAEIGKRFPKLAPAFKRDDCQRDRCGLPWEDQLTETITRGLWRCSCGRWMRLSENCCRVCRPVGEPQITYEMRQGSRYDPLSRGVK